jgi:hypothetical protein
MKKQNKRENWEEKYWQIWERDNDLTHIDDDVFAFIKELLTLKEKEVKEETFGKLIRWCSYMERNGEQTIDIAKLRELLFKLKK